MKTTCPECMEQFDVTRDMLGKKAKCGECGHVFVVPAGSKSKKSDQADDEDTVDARQTAWLSLYLAGLALLMLLYSGHQSSMIAGMLFGLAIETAALYLVWRAWKLAWSLRTEKRTELIRMAILVNGLLMGLFFLSILLSLYSLIAPSGAGGLGGLGNLNDLLKSLKDMGKLAPN